LLLDQGPTLARALRYFKTHSKLAFSNVRLTYAARFKSFSL
jgi:hypothetical protein